MALFGKKKGNSPSDDLRKEVISAAAKAAADQAAKEAATKFDPEQLSAARVGDALDRRAQTRHEESRGLLYLGAFLAGMTLVLVSLWGFSGGSSAGVNALNRGMSAGFERVYARLDAIDARLLALESKPCRRACALEIAPKRAVSLPLDRSQCYLANGQVIRTGSRGSIGLADRWRPARQFGAVRLHACLFPERIEARREQALQRTHRVYCREGAYLGRKADGSLTCFRPRSQPWRSSQHSWIDGGQGSGPPSGTGADRGESHGGTPAGPSDPGADRGESHGGTPADPGATGIGGNDAGGGGRGGEGHGAGPA